MKRISEQVFLVTGATDGLGKAVAFSLADKGASVIIHGRNPEKGENVMKAIKRATGNDKLVYYNADFSSLEEVRRLADTILSSHQELDVLINNAGIGGGEKTSGRQLSADGYELRLAVNYLAPFLLTHLLLPLLIKSEPSRIVNVASASQESLSRDDLMLEKNYNGSRAYAQSKLALVMFTFTLAEKLREHALKVNCLHPGSMMDTKMVREGGGKPRTKVEEGVDSVLYVALHRETELANGAYFDQKYPESAEKQAYDEDMREWLYQMSSKATGL